MRIEDMFGNILKTACNGNGTTDAFPSADPDGAHGYCIEASNIQTTVDAANVLVIIEEQRLWMTAAAHTLTYKIQTNYAALAADKLTLRAKYIGTDGAITEVNAHTAIATRDDTADWSETLAVTFAPSVDGWVSVSMDLILYESGKVIYVWPSPVIT